MHQPGAANTPEDNAANTPEDSLRRWLLEAIHVLVHPYRVRQTSTATPRPSTSTPFPPGELSWKPTQFQNAAKQNLARTPSIVIYRTLETGRVRRVQQCGKIRGLEARPLVTQGDADVLARGEKRRQFTRYPSRPPWQTGPTHHRQ